MSTVRWEHPSVRRWYAVSVVRDLLGDSVMVTRWGSLATRRGGLRSQALADARHAAHCIGQLARGRARRGYVLMALREHDAGRTSKETLTR